MEVNHMINEINGYRHDNRNIPGGYYNASPGIRNGDFQGNVKLCVEGADSAQMVISFVNTLRQKPCVRLLGIAGTCAAGVEIRIELRKPMDFISALRQLEGVSKVETSPAKEKHDDVPQVNVELARTAYAGVS